jgi:glycosyltransferase involved in cell wall biosynthesis
VAAPLFHSEKDHSIGFTILIPTWNNLPYLQLCLQSIADHSVLKHQVIVIVNEGTDGTKEWVESQQNIDTVYFKENVGICHALNKGAQLANTDYILYMNDDMYVLPGWDQALKDEIVQLPHPKFFLSSTMIEPTDTGNNCVIVKDYGTNLENFRKEDLLREYASLEKADWNGGTWPPNVMPKVLWNMVGGMSHEFSPGMYSDPDLSMKLWQKGVRYYKGLGNSRVYHFGTKSTGRIKHNKGRETFLHKWGISAGDFARYYLKRGTPFKGPLPDAKITLLQKWVNKFKRGFK